MSEFFSFMRTGLICSTIMGIAFMIALSLPKSRLRTVVTEICCYASVVFCAFYCISPVDCIPEAALGPVGFIDDIGAVWLGWEAIKSALKCRKERQEIEA